MRFCKRLGRASIAPILDLFITLLNMGSIKYKQLLDDRKDMYDYFKSQLEKFAEEIGERPLQTKNNPISFGKFYFFFCPQI